MEAGAFLRLDAHDAHIGERGGNPCGQTSAAGCDHHGVEVFDLLGEFDTHGALAGDGERRVERVDGERTRFFDACVTRRLCVGVALTGDTNVGAKGANTGDLDRR